MYGGELLYLRIFLKLSPPSNFGKRELPYPRGLKIMRACMLSYGESRGNDNVRKLGWMIAPNL